MPIRGRGDNDTPAPIAHVVAADRRPPHPRRAAPRGAARRQQHRARLSPGERRGQSAHGDDGGDELRLRGPDD